MRIPVHVIFFFFFSSAYYLHGSQHCFSEGACITQWSYEQCPAGTSKRDGSLEENWQTWSTGGRIGKSLQYSCCKKPMNSRKRQKDMTLEDETLMSESVQYATGEKQREIIAPESTLLLLLSRFSRVQLCATP